MKNRFGLILVFLSILCIFSTVTAWHADVTLSGPEGPVCPKCDFFSYTISANSLIWPEHVLRVTDVLPAGLVYVEGSSSTQPGGNVDPQWNPLTRTLTWDFYNVPQNKDRNIIFNVRPSDLLPGQTSVINTANTQVMPYGSRSWESREGVTSNTVTTTFSDSVCPQSDPISTPEFPTMAFPAGLITGLIGAVLYIQRREEN